MSDDKDSIRRQALSLIESDGRRIAPRLAQEFGLSRQVANGHLQSMAREGLIDAEGTTRARVYRIRTLAEAARNYPCEGLQEDLVWRELIAPVVARFPENVRDIWHYAATEMINNAIDHSGAPEALVNVTRNALYTEVVVADEGEGIFQKIQRAFDLHDAREAILELAKGKLTTAPEQHTGEVSSLRREHSICSRSSRSSCVSATRPARTIPSRSRRARRQARLCGCVSPSTVRASYGSCSRRSPARINVLSTGR